MDPYAKALSITQTPAYRERAPDVRSKISDTARDMLAAALGSMKNLRTVKWEVRESDSQWETNPIRNFLTTVVRTGIWEMHQSDSEWERNTISHVLIALPLLNDLQLTVTGKVELPIGRLSERLTKLKITTPGRKPAQISKQVSRAVAQARALTSLELTGDCDWSAVWTILRRGAGAQIYLKDIRTNVTPSLLAYLASYSGIERLELEKITHAGSREASDRLADYFLASVLPHHTASLMVLSCCAPYESRWSFGPHSVDAILQLHKLTSLAMSVNLADVLDEPLINTVDLLLRNVPLLPELQDIFIYGTITEPIRGAWCGNCIYGLDLA